MQMLTNLQAAHKLAIGFALLAAVVCSTSSAEERSEVRIAFQDATKESEPTPPAQPGPAPTPVNHVADDTDESLPAPAATSSTHCEPQQFNHCCPPPAYTRWPVIGPLHRRWITHTKPHMQASHWGYPQYFEERPYGSYVLQAEQMQIVNGLRDQQVLYNYDFGLGDHAAELTPRGQYQLRKIICRMQISPCPIIVQISDVNNPNPELDEARRQFVLDALRQAGMPATDELVISDRPPLPGLQGSEGVMVYGNMLLQTQARGGGFDFDPAGDIGGTVSNVNIYSGSNNTFSTGGP
jgi:hypothetical protein